MSNKSDFLYPELSHQILGAAFMVHSALGCGLPEFTYEAALELRFGELEIPCTRQERFDVFFHDTRVGHFVSDLVVDNLIILELKSDESILPGHVSQLFTYLRVTGLRVGLLLNFGERSLQFKRLIL